MTKPRVPADHILYEGLTDKVFLGDSQAQASAVKKVTQDFDEGKSGVYVLVGPSFTGKDTAFNRVAEHVSSKGDTFVSANYGGSEDDKQYFSEHPNARKVIRIDTAVEAQFLEPLIKRSNNILKHHPNTVIVIDALLHEPRLPTAKEPESVTQDRQMLADIQKNHPEVTFLQTKHDPLKVKDAMWQLHEKLQEEFSGTGNAIRNELLDGQKGARVNEIVKALNDNDKSAYDTAFDALLHGKHQGSAAQTQLARKADGSQRSR
jgi:hypothetical protein